MAKCKGRCLAMPEVRGRMIEHEGLILDAIDYLEQRPSFWFCFVKILQCNAGYSVSFTQAWCETVRNIDKKINKDEDADEDEYSKSIVYLPDLFNCAFVRSFMGNESANEFLDSHVVALARLTDFLDNMKETEKTLFEARASGRLKEESSWAAILGIHILKKLSVSQDMTFDSRYSEKTEKCPCGSAQCGEKINTGDNSIGNSQVWHGCMDILIGGAAIAIQPNLEESETDMNSAVEVKGLFCTNLEEYRHQLIAELIVLTFFCGEGLTPLMCISGTKIKVFMYDKESDLLFESHEENLFDDSCMRIRLPVLIVIWLIINYKYFCTGVKRIHKDVGFTSDFKSFLNERHLAIYEKGLQRGSCRFGKRSLQNIVNGDQWCLKRLKPDN